MNTKIKYTFAALFVVACIGIGAFLQKVAIADSRVDGIGAASYAIQNVDSSNYVITVLTGSTKTVTLLDRDYTLVHLNIQNDGSTASVSTDYAVMMPLTKSDGTSIAMDATYGDGAKMIVAAGAAATFSANDILNGVDGPREVQIQAVGHGCKMLFIRGNVPH